jgi:hypothetical protein
MKSYSPSDLALKRASKMENSHQTKLIKKYYFQFLEMMSRKTDSDKRTKLFGKDPFK